MYDPFLRLSHVFVSKRKGLLVLPILWFVWHCSEHVVDLLVWCLLCFLVSQGNAQHINFYLIIISTILWKSLGIFLHMCYDISFVFEKLKEKYFYNFILCRQIKLIYEFFTGVTMVLSDNCVRDLHFCDDTADTEPEHQR